MTIRFPAPITPEHFLRDYWQREPLLCPAGLAEQVASLEGILTPETLAGLACEDEIEARLVVCHGRSPSEWGVRNGPFQPEEFTRLPARGWSLLVQDVDKYVPQVAALLSHFRFLPAWRIDDIMVSYAAPGGTVGPHIDDYDVFLLQGEGSRTWKIGRSDGILHANAPLRVVKNFSPTDSFDLQAGDALYLPPGVAHFGLSESACMTLSVGFRAPSVQEMIIAEAEYRAEQASGRYRDDGIVIDEADDGLISVAAIERASAFLGRSRSYDDFMWFGCLVTENKPWLLAEPPDAVESLDQFGERLRNGGVLLRDPRVRTARSEHPSPGLLFVDGEALTLSRNNFELAPAICGDGALPPVDHEEAMSLLYGLYCDGKLYFR